MKVFLTRTPPEAGPRKLREAGLELRIRESSRPIGKPELIEGLRDADAAFTFLTDPVDAEVLGASKRLRVIGQMAAGLENIDLDAAAARRIVVCHTPGILTEACADFAFALMLAAARRVPEGDRAVREGRFEGWGPEVLLGLPVYGHSLGILGMGQIGAAVARRARGFDMAVLYASRTRKGQLESQWGLQWQPLDTILKEVDFLSIHLPGGKDTFHRIGAGELSLMKRTAILVNMSRGGVVDDAALAAALRERRIAAAALDVFEGEPRVHPELLRLGNVVLAPHAASATSETRNRMAASAAEQIVAVLAGKRPAHCANPEVLAGGERHTGGQSPPSIPR